MGEEDDKESANELIEGRQSILLFVYCLRLCLGAFLVIEFV